jgi:hypothetical protein
MNGRRLPGAGANSPNLLIPESDRRHQPSPGVVAASRLETPAGLLRLRPQVKRLHFWNAFGELLLTLDLRIEFGAEE